MECPYCHSQFEPETPCMTHPPVPMSYWPSRSGMPEMVTEPVEDVAPAEQYGD
ncbi:MAG: hypothetical protein ACE14L_07115 [Terriglobales bacterium]